MKEYTACFTGHREIENLIETQKRHIEATFDLIGRGVRHFLIGGATGFDIIAGQHSFYIKTAVRHMIGDIKLTMVLPCSFDIFTKKWSEIDRKRLEHLMTLTDENIILQENYSADCYKKRNQYLVENSRYCICYYNESRYRSGTGQTVRMAEKQGLEIINIF
ncbi:MAG: DUF1273 domain-containing protein [Oscillospiraceae bacterium]|nr:DUF1273 domain-containing protein [Oscillospiraceae bacterium]